MLNGVFANSIREISKQLVDIRKPALETELQLAPTTDGTEDERVLEAASALEKELREAGNEVTRELNQGEAEGDDRFVGSVKVSQGFGRQGPKQLPLEQCVG